MNDLARDWQALAADWQGQDTPAIDVAALRGESARRGRNLRWVVILEIVFTAIGVAMLGYAAWASQLATERLLIGLLAVFLVVYQAAMVWLRRRQWNDSGLDAGALLALELRRARTVLLYHRWGIWTCVGLWLVFYALLLVGMAQDAPFKQLAGLVGGLLGASLTFPLAGLYGVWRCGQARARIGRLQAMRAQLES